MTQLLCRLTWGTPFCIVWMHVSLQKSKWSEKSHWTSALDQGRLPISSVDSQLLLLGLFSINLLLGSEVVCRILHALWASSEFHDVYPVTRNEEQTHGHVCSLVDNMMDLVTVDANQVFEATRKIHETVWKLLCWERRSLLVVLKHWWHLWREKPGTYQHSKARILAQLCSNSLMPYWVHNGSVLLSTILLHKKPPANKCVWCACSIWCWTCCENTTYPFANHKSVFVLLFFTKLTCWLVNWPWVLHTMYF